MSDTNAKGRRAADRRRQRQGDDEEELPKEHTRPGVSFPEEVLADDEVEVTDRDRKVPPPRERPRTSVTSVTSVTKVGDAAKEAMQESPLEPTAVKPLSLGPALQAGRLICLEGKDVGKSFDLTQEDNELTLAQFLQQAHIQWHGTHLEQPNWSAESRSRREGNRSRWPRAAVPPAEDRRSPPAVRSSAPR